ncbi:MAG: hypothetical protein Q8P41_17035 [Pseudomonadota bacterium]|nr:hypothetical protein [Pseudomonadota bacterium]
MASLLFLTLLGCFASPFEGTWLVQADRESKVDGDCATDDDTQSTGTDNFWMDIFKTGGGDLVVLYSEALVGTPDGSELTAEWEQTERGDDFQETETIEFRASLEGGVMSGSVTGELVSVSGEDTYRCTLETDFSAERNVSAPSAYPEQ